MRRRCEQVQQDPSSYEVCALVPRSLGGFAWQHARPSRPPGSLRVYEVHVGIATAREEVGRWSDLRTDLLPRIANLGYTALRLGSTSSPRQHSMLSPIHKVID